MSENIESGEHRESEKYRVGPGKPPIEHRFSSTNQPPGKLKKLGHLKKKRGRELLDGFLKMKYVGSADKQLLKGVSEYFGVDPTDVTNEMMMYLRQIERSIKNSDNKCFNSVMDRIYGKSKEIHEISGPGGKPIEHISSNGKIDFENLPDEVVQQILNARIDQEGRGEQAG